MTALLLGTYGLFLSLVAPQWLARARWPVRAPRAAIVLWQAVVLASVLSALGVVLAGPEETVRARGSGPVGAAWVLAAALGVAALIVGRLLVSLTGVLRRSQARRERHRLLVDLLDRAERRPELVAAEALSGVTAVRVLDGAVPFAYCVPGRSPRVVLSDGALGALAADELAAVLAHEQAHLRARHDLVLESFTAVQRAVPARLRSDVSLRAVHLLLEMLADDGACRVTGAGPLHAALTALGGAVSTSVSPAAGDPDGAGRDPGDERERRRARLAAGAPTRSPATEAAAYLAAAGVVVVPTVAVVVPWLVTALPHLSR